MYWVYRSSCLYSCTRQLSVTARGLLVVINSDKVIKRQCATNRPSSSISRHITVDLYGILGSSDEHSVDTVYAAVDLRTVTWFCRSK